MDPNIVCLAEIRARIRMRTMRPSRLTTQLCGVLDLVIDAIDETERLGDSTGTANLVVILHIIANEIDRRPRM